MSARRALVTGAAGFLGRTLVRRLLADGRPVVALIRPTSGSAALSGADIEIYDGNSASLDAVMEKHRPITVFHLAAVGGGVVEAGVDEIIRSNVLLGAQLAAACARTKVERFVSAGTFFTRRSGSADYDPVSLYAASKKAFETILEYYARAEGLRAATVCLYDIYGPDDSRPKLLNMLAESARTRREIKLSPGEQQLDVLHVDDAAAALLAAERALEGAPAGALREWCASSGERRSLRALVELFTWLTGLAPRANFGAKPYRDREIMKPWIGETVPGWKPKIALKDGLRQTYGTAART